ncbi:DEAD/DEAH box helicase [Streptococcaceae bacterium ESL0729]|nr:DEAD/DEAH box helicase [Streptococcaceae bacterium ESL0729]
MDELLYGRIVSKSELDYLPEEDCQVKSMIEEGRYILCNRCISKHLKEEVRLPIGAYFCPSCLKLGRVRSDESLYHLKQVDFPKRDESVLSWSGQLTDLQNKISEELLQALKDKEEIWVHAVTGAGKTEMTYQVVAKIINEGGSVGFASPRVDVCLELYKRLVKDFSLDICLLHADGDKYFRSQLTILTTHQLLRFKEAFDLLIIDEVDAFPFKDNELLYQAAEKARRKCSCLIYLTATATNNLDQKVKSGHLKKATLARRFHGKPLVIPQNIWCHIPWDLRKLPKKLISYLRRQRATGYPLLIFVPVIGFGQKFTAALKDILRQERIAFVSSLSEDRKEQVEKFREGQLDILVTTTILERGVTFPRVDVFILQANHRLFNSSSLVQIGGRVGRSMERPDGLIYFFHDGKSQAMNKAIKEIKLMNKLGGF